MSSFIMKKQSFFWFVADENGVFYSPFSDWQKQRQQIDTERAKFLVSLIEKQGFQESEIKVDFELAEADIFDSVDLLAFKNSRPYLAADFLPGDVSVIAKKEAKIKLLRKAEFLKAQTACLCIGKNKNCFFI